MIFINYSSFPEIVAVPQVNRLFASFLLRRLEFDPYEVRVWLTKWYIGFLLSPTVFLRQMSFHKTTTFIHFFSGDR